MMNHLSKLTIIIDTREQTPLHFPEHLAKVERGTLKQGDYALKNDNGFAIERKSLDDFIGTISSGWARFKKELNRMTQANFPARIIVIESDVYATCFNGKETPKHNHYKITSRFIFSRIAQLSYSGVQVLFAGNRELSSLLIWRILLERHYDLNGIVKREEI